MGTGFSFLLSTILPPDTSPALSVKSTITYNNLYININNTLIDSGASACFIDNDFAERHKIVKVKRNKSSVVRMIDGRTLSSGAVTEITEPLLLTMGEHTERIVFNVIRSPSYPIILGMTWLKHHNPIINWKDKTIKFICCTSSDTKVASDISVGNPTSLLNPADKFVSLNKEVTSEIKPSSENFRSSENVTDSTNFDSGTENRLPKC